MVDFSFLPPVRAVLSDEPTKLRLPGGRDLAFTQWGDGAGFPVFYFHGTPSSRLEGAFADAAARRHRFRLVAVDRPGFGQSTFQHHRRFLDWPEDVLALADHLKIDRFAVAGHSGAGPHLLACGVCIDPKRLACIGALGPWGPVASADIAKSLNRLDHAFANAARQRPWLMRMGFAPMGWAARWWPDLFFGLMKRSVATADRRALEDPGFTAIFRSALREAFRQGSRGAAHEAHLAYTDWGFDIASVRVPTHIWLGDQDVFVSNTMGRYLEQRIPGVDFHWVAAAGHLNVEDWHQIFAACRESIGRAAP
ncbi:alpha/beta hydrolase [Roseobacter sp. WL0113]|uniref:Alpha/beta hydrolase n=2 Tax=Roseobacter sinensis TaxID=2931391 RepID=A0ABT3BFG1_9RHOB|nr:alpha/beta hydrolase [Roseobacter sp. WL0113]